MKEGKEKGSNGTEKELREAYQITESESFRGI